MPRANKKISLAESIKEALVLSMKKDKNVLIIGLGVDDPKGIFGTTKGIDKIFKNMEDIQSVQNKISSGKNILFSSDDPVGAVQLSGMKDVLGKVDRFIENSNIALDRLHLMDSTMEAVNNVFIRSKELAIQAANDIYGVMDRNLNTAGAIVVSKNKQSYVVDDDIFIPNTFINIPGTNDLLISDSMQYKIFKFQFSKNWETVVNKSTWLDLSEEKLTPDGGCISSDGRIFIAIWDGFKVIELNLNGNIVDEFKVPVPRPTNCALDIKEDKLFVTSAYDGLSSNKRKQYPLSGSIIEVDVRGQRC